MANDVVTKLRQTYAEQAQWRAQADKVGVSLSEWIRCRCNGDVIAPSMSRPTIVTTSGAGYTEPPRVAEIRVAAPVAWSNLKPEKKR